MSPAPSRDARAELISHEDRGEVLETPQAQLSAHLHTPAEVMFVRNNNPYPPGTDTLRPLPASGALELAGLQGGPVTLDLAALSVLPHTEVEAVMQCAGNGRAFYRGAEHIEGSAWRRGGVMNGVFGGVPLSEVLAGRVPELGARFLTATGHDGGCGYEKSVPLADALARALLVDRLNGESLCGAHGGPLRLVLPGYFGTVNVKWLRRLSFTPEETAHEAQQERYRVPTEDGGSRPCWRQPLKSLLLSPEAGEVRPAGPLTASGVAFNDGRCAIAQIELTLDGGASWRPAELEPARGLYAWRRWQASLDLPSGQHTLGVRATDAEGRAQPLDGNATWNPEGYGWQGVDFVTFELR